MLVTNGKFITMTDSEWVRFQALTFAPWVPQTIDEFNAMCDLGRARHHRTGGGPGNHEGISCDCIKFDEDGTPHFPENHRKLAFIKVHGYSPSDQELAMFESGEMPTSGKPPKLSLLQGGQHK